MPVLAVGDGESVHALEPVPLAASIELRAAAGEYAGALELCSYLPAAQGAEREALEGSLRVRHGFHLVAAGDVAGGPSAPPEETPEEPKDTGWKNNAGKNLEVHVIT